MQRIPGWILAPLETEEALLKRKELLRQAPISKEKRLSLPLYDLKEIEACIVYQNDSLLPWQGGVLWEYFTETGDKYPVIQIKKAPFKRCEEVKAHELVHAVRFAFKEPFFEEMLAYQTSKSALRRFFGSFFIYPFESVLFAGCSFLSPLISLFFDSFFGAALLLFLFGFFFLRLLVLHSLFFLCKAKLEKISILPQFSLAVMLRLSDFEIVKMAFFSSKKAALYFQKGSLQEARLKEIIDCYFKAK